MEQEFITDYRILNCYDSSVSTREKCSNYWEDSFSITVRHLSTIISSSFFFLYHPHYLYSLIEYRCFYYFDILPIFRAEYRSSPPSLYTLTQPTPEASNRLQSENRRSSSAVRNVSRVKHRSSTRQTQIRDSLPGSVSFKLFPTVASTCTRLERDPLLEVAPVVGCLNEKSPGR